MPTTTGIDTLDYPTSDGKPMAETGVHRELLWNLIHTLEADFADRSDVYLSGNLLVYYEKGNIHKVLTPDCFVVFGVPKRRRTICKTWDEGSFPSVVFELPSKSTRQEDLIGKLEVYRDLWNVEEYFLFDVLGEYLASQLQGYCRHNHDFVPIERTFGQLRSEILGIDMESVNNQLHLFDRETHRRLYPADLQRALDEERKRRQEEHARNQAERDRELAERDRDLAEQERDAERSTRLQLEAKLARLKAQLQAQNPPPSS